jgi:hypothetical protein
MWDFSNFYTSISKNCSDYKMEILSSGLNNIQNEWFNSYANINSSRNEK